MITMRRLAVLSFGVLFVALKLIDKIDWSWWIVLAPLWVPYAIIALGTGLQRVVWLTMTPRERALVKLRATIDELERQSR